MRGDSLPRKNLCPACGRLMDLTRTIAASPGHSELRTYGCAACGLRKKARQKICSSTRSQSANRDPRAISVRFFLIALFSANSTPPRWLGRVVEHDRRRVPWQFVLTYEGITSPSMRPRPLQTGDHNG